jgi:hypothetical protein
MAREIDFDVIEHLRFIGFEKPDPNNALLVFEHQGEHHFYHVSMDPFDYGSGKNKVPNYRVLNHDVRHVLPENLEKEVEAAMDEIEGVKPMIIKETIPLSGDLQYKLDYAVVFYLFCARYVDEEGT